MRAQWSGGILLLLLVVVVPCEDNLITRDEGSLEAVVGEVPAAAAKAGEVPKKVDSDFFAKTLGRDAGLNGTLRPWIRSCLFSNFVCSTR
jgi:hypothetical protein